MRNKVAKVGLTTVVVAGALAALLGATLNEGTEYYKHVDEVMANPDSWHGKRLQLHGYVVKDSIYRRRDSLDYEFMIESNGRAIQARYTGVVPDTFKSGAEVVIKGRLEHDRFQVERDGIMAKCPSKYEASR